MKYAILLMLLFTFFLSLTAQNANWLNFTNGNDITCVTEEGNFLWIGTYGGLVKLDKQSGTASFYNPANSGLASIDVSDIAIDSQGNKWIGTSNGLCKFDGTNWSTYAPPDEEYFAVRALAIDAQDNIWVASGDLYNFDGVSNWTNHTHLYPTIPLYYITSLAFNQQGKLLVGTWNALCKYNGNSWTFELNQQILPNSYFSIEDIVVDNNNFIWMQTSINGLLRYNGTGWHNFTSENSELPHNWTSGLYCDTENNIWVGTYQGYLAKFNGSIWTIYSSDTNPLFTNPIRVISQDSQNNIWIGSTGLFKQTGATWTSYNTSNSGLRSNQAYEVYLDNQNTMWTNAGHGLTKYSGGVWAYYDSLNSGLPANSTRCFDSDNAGNLWLIANPYNSGNSNVVKFDGVNWTVFNNANSSLPACINNLTVDNQNNVWVSGTDNVICKFDGIAWTTLQTPVVDPYNYGIYNLFADSQNNLWALIGYNGLAKFNGTDWTQYTYTDAGIQPGTYLCSYIDPQNNIWIGNKGNLLRFNGTNWTEYNIFNSAMPYSFAAAIGMDNQNNLWVRACTDEDNGCLAKFDGTNWTSINSPDIALTSSTIYSIVADSYDNIWLGTNGGISVYNETGIVANVDDTQSPVAVSAIIAYPNPCGQTSNISFAIETKSIGKGSLDIYNLKGQKVKSISVSTDRSTLSWDKKDSANHIVAPGLYFYKLTIGKLHETRKLVILK